MIYHIFAEALLNHHIDMCEKGMAETTYTYINIPKYGNFGFCIMYNYEGLMAQPSRTGRNKGIVKRKKQGLFDISINTGSFFGAGGMTHRDILTSVKEYSCLEHCYDVWRGIEPTKIAKSDEELAILVTIALAFFEQEVNWGNESWQRYTYFAPKVTIPNRIRPRDMLMGYICQVFALGVDNIAYWMTSRPTTTTFMAPDRSNYGYEDYAEEYKRFFLQLQDDEYATALIVGDCRKDFRRVADMYANNPFYRR
jgi:hypothetical protein